MNLSALTPNQSRDMLLDATPPAASFVREIRNAAQMDAEARKADAETFAKCPRCYGLHSVRGNFDNLCDTCQETILEHFPDHASVPFIRAALLSRWPATPKGGAQ